MKEPWEMTATEYIGTKDIPQGEKEVFARSVQTHKAIANHESTVRQALSEGKPVPPEVLADYPDLIASNA